MFELNIKLTEKNDMMKVTIQTIKNYIECLLNTRRGYFDSALEDAGLEKSLLNYGLPDLGHFNPHSKSDVKKLCLMVEDAIETHENRIKNVRVSLIENKTSENELKVLLCIKAHLPLNNLEKEIEFFSEFNRISQVFLLKDA